MGGRMGLQWLLCLTLTQVALGWGWDSTIYYTNDQSAEHPCPVVTMVGDETGKQLGMATQNLLET